MVGVVRMVKILSPSMKVPPKRKGNPRPFLPRPNSSSLNESPSEKEGKWVSSLPFGAHNTALNESPSEKEGKFTSPSAMVFGLNGPQ